MKVVVQFIKFLCYSVITVVEFILTMLLDIIMQMKKGFQ
jgi:hypothetical protein